MKKIVLLLSLILISNIAWSLNFSIAPTKFQVDLSKTTNHEAYLINNTSKPLRIKVYTEVPTSYEKHNLNENITIFPKMISIKPGAKESIRFRVKPLKNVEGGEYRSFLVFEEMVNEIKTKEIKKGKGLSTDLNMITQVVLNVYGETGDSEVKGKVEKINFSVNKEELEIEAVVLSEGNSAVKINYLLKEGEEVVGEGRFGTSLRSGKSIIKRDIPLNTSNFKELEIILLDQNSEIIYSGKVKI